MMLESYLACGADAKTPSQQGAHNKSFHNIGGPKTTARQKQHWQHKQHKQEGKRASNQHIALASLEFGEVQVRSMRGPADIMIPYSTSSFSFLLMNMTLIVLRCPEPVPTHHTDDMLTSHRQGICSVWFHDQNSLCM